MKKSVLFTFFSLIFLCLFSFSAFAKESDELQVKSLKFLKGEQDAVSFSWKASEDAEFFYIYRLNEDTGNYEIVKAVKEAAATVENLESGKNHYFRVLPIKYEKGRKVSGRASNSLVCVTAPEGDLVAYSCDISDNSITLQWNKIAGATGYKVFYSDAKSNKLVAYKHTPKLKMRVDGLEKNKEYKFIVKAYRWVDNALAYGVTSDVCYETTDKDGVPETPSQLAKAYNAAVNNAKKQGSMTVNFIKSIDNRMYSCSKDNLALSVQNTLNLYKGSLNRTYKFASGKSGNVTAKGLFEPCYVEASVIGNDISSYRIRPTENGYTAVFSLKKDENGLFGGSYCDGAISVTDIEKIDTTPLKVVSADTTYNKVIVSFSVVNGRLTALKIKADVDSDISFRASTVSAQTSVGCTLSEQYKITY